MEDKKEAEKIKIRMELNCSLSGLIQGREEVLAFGKPREKIVNDYLS